MKLAKVRYTDDVIWFVDEPRSTINQPTVGTIVQYDVYGDTFRVYFPGVQGYAPMGEEMFNVCFEPL